MKRFVPVAAAGTLVLTFLGAAQETAPSTAPIAPPPSGEQVKASDVPANEAPEKPQTPAERRATARAQKAKKKELPEGTVLPPMVPLSNFQVPEGLEITVWATTPMLYNPTNIDFDQEGRLYVAEGVNYRKHTDRRPEGDRIVVLEDTDGDGQADKVHTFVQEKNLIAPLGVAVFDNQVVVSQPPDMLLYTDVDRDGVIDLEKGDKREVLLTGFNGRNHDHSLHSVTTGPDGLWYWSMGNTGAMFTDKSQKTFRIGSSYVHQMAPDPVDSPSISGQKSDDGHVWVGGFSARMRPDGSHVEITGFNYRNSFEQTCNSFGDLFQSDNDDPPACRVDVVMEGGNAGFASRDGKRTWLADRRPGQPKAVAEWRQEDPGTMPAGDVYGGGSPTGVAFYENGALGDKWRGLLLACEAGRNQIFGYFPKPDGAGFKLERFIFLTSNQEGKFAGSDFLGGGGSVTGEMKTLFRPSDVCVGPDGALYVADWFDPRVGGHSDLDEQTYGTIYRIAPKGFKSVVPKLDLTTTEGQIAALKSPALNVRNVAFHTLQAKGETAVPALAALLHEENPFLAARAIWLLAQMGPAGVAQVQPLLASKDEQVRLVAYRALRRADYEVLAMAKKMAIDPSAAVRREVALSMRDVPYEESHEILLKIARRFNGRDRAYLEAFGTGCSGKEREMYRLIAEAAGTPPERWQEAMVWLAWRLSAPESVPALKSRALAPGTPPAQRKTLVDALAFIPSPYAALAMVDLAATPDFSEKDDALWWLLSRQGNLWLNYGLPDALKEKGLYDPAQVVLTSIVAPEPPAEPSKLQVSEILQLQGDLKRGSEAVTVCYTCHKIGSQGVDVGPELTMFGKTQPREVLLTAIIDPSADISHGYEASHLLTNDGLVIDGIALSSDDPVLMKSMGGVVQTVPQARIKRISKMRTSLMLSADQLGLTPQMLADIVTYLQSDEIH